MTISVIIASYNCLSLLKHTIASLEKQDLPFTEFEVIVVDDCSSDLTAEYLRAYTGPLRLKPLINETNLGRARSRNRGIRAAENELIVFLDADTEVLHSFLRTHHRSQIAEPQVSVGVRIFHPDLPKTGLMRYLEKRGAAKFPEGAEIPPRYFVSCNASVPRRVLLSEGGFDERFVHYGGEDLELGLRLAKRLPVRSLPSALGCHRHYRELDEFLEITQGFGRHSLPLIISTHPGIEIELGFSDTGRKTLRSFLIKIACAKPFFLLIKQLGKLAFMPPIVYNYLIFRSYRAGYISNQ